MYDSGVFIQSFFGFIFGLFVTELVRLMRGKLTPAIVLPATFAIIASMIGVEDPSNLWRFAIKH